MGNLSFLKNFEGLDDMPSPEPVDIILNKMYYIGVNQLAAVDKRACQGLHYLEALYPVSELTLR